jgi:2-polyprenyl-6-methoxyphenol hydroxylase-like FAD-dependent oxidoreductase
MSEPQVIIVGGGPVGMGLAIELGQRGVPVTVVEQRVGLSPIPKGQNLTQRTMEHFHFWGAEPQLRAARTFPPDFGMGGLTAYETLTGDYAYTWMPRELVAPFYFKENERLPQYATEEVLRARAAQIPAIEILYGWKAEAVSQDAEKATVEIAELEGEGRRALHAPYLVGCDGSWSMVRQAAGITQTLSDHDKTMVLLVFRSAALNKLLLERYPGKCFFSVLKPEFGGYWNFFGRVDVNDTFFFHAPVPAGTTRDNFDFSAMLDAAAGASIEADIQQVGFWSLRFAVADSYRNGRLFVAGDAAHSHPPYGGYGVNTGFEDARNLGWKLAAKLQGWGGEALLESYSAERQPVFKGTSDSFIERSILDDRAFLAAFDPRKDKAAFEAKWHDRSTGAVAEVGAFEPNYEGSRVVYGPEGGVSGAVGKHMLKARAGHHLAPRTLSDGRNVYEALGDGFTLIALGADGAEVAAFEAAAKALNAPLTVVRDTAEAGREDYEARLVLVRPDQFVAWTSDDANEEPRRVLEKTLGF